MRSKSKDKNLFYPRLILWNLSLIDLKPGLVQLRKCLSTFVSIVFVLFLAEGCSLTVTMLSFSDFSFSPDCIILSLGVEVVGGEHMLLITQSFLGDLPSWGLGVDSSNLLILAAKGLDCCRSKPTVGLASGLPGKEMKSFEDFTELLLLITFFSKTSKPELCPMLIVTLCCDEISDFIIGDSLGVDTEIDGDSFDEMLDDGDALHVINTEFLFSSDGNDWKEYSILEAVVFNVGGKDDTGASVDFNSDGSILNRGNELLLLLSREEGEDWLSSPGDRGGDDGLIEVGGEGSTVVEEDGESLCTSVEGVAPGDGGGDEQLTLGDVILTPESPESFLLSSVLVRFSITGFTSGLTSSSIIVVALTATNTLLSQESDVAFEFSVSERVLLFCGRFVSLNGTGFGLWVVSWN